MPEEREMAIAEGVGLLAAGATYDAASEAVGIPRTTLHDAYMRTLGPNAPNAEERRKQADARIMATAYCVAEQTLGRMAAEAGEAEHRTLTAWAEVSSKVLSRMRGWDNRASGLTDTAPRWASTLERILDSGGATVTVTVQRPDNDTE